MKKATRNTIAVLAATILAVVAAHCSGCAIVEPEGEMIMEVPDGE